MGERIAYGVWGRDTQYGIQNKNKNPSDGGRDSLSTRVCIPPPALSGSGSRVERALLSGGYSSQPVGQAPRAGIFWLLGV